MAGAAGWGPAPRMKTVKGLVLSGGRGTRMRPITHTMAKQLIPVANKPILHFVVEDLVKAGITEVGVITGDTAAEIREALGDGSRWGCQITYIQQEAPLGLAHAVKTAREFLGDDEFVMYLGDNLLLEGIGEFVGSFTQRRPNAMILLTRVPQPQHFGVAELEDGRVVRLEEKPKVPRSDLALVGVYLFDRTVWPAIDTLKPSARGEYEITHAIQAMIDGGRVVEPHIITGWWKDTGRLEDMLEANRMILEGIEHRIDGSVNEGSRVEGRVVIEKGAQLHNSTVRGPAIIGENTILRDSYVGPFTSIYFGCEVVGSEIEHSIVLENSKILNVTGKIEGSLVGKDVVVTQSVSKPKAHKLMLGDNSRVEIL